MRLGKSLNQLAVILVMLIEFVFLEDGLRGLQFLEQDQVLFVNTIILNLPVYVVKGASFLAGR